MPKTKEPKGPRTPEEVTSSLGRHYKAWKDNEKAKNADRDEFFALISASHIEDPDMLEERLVTVSAKDIEAAEKRLEKYYPRFTVDEIRQVPCPRDNDGDGDCGQRYCPDCGVMANFEAILLERPEYKPGQFINVEDGMVYQKQIQDGSPLLDDERLEVEDESLYLVATFPLPWGDRIVRPFDTLDAETLAKLQDYIYRGKPTVKLPAPRKATEEELASVTA